MDGFIGRRNELKKLEDLYRNKSGSCAISGRRHIGKTSLIRKFSEGKEHIYISGYRGLPSDNLRMIKQELSRFAGRDVKLPDIMDLFDVIAELCRKKEKTLVIIDRYSDLVENFSAFDSAVRDFMLRGLNNTRILLVVCDEGTSLFDRFYVNIKLDRMNFRECAGFHPDYTPRQNLMVYSIVGGVPAYHAEFGDDPEKTIRMKMFDHLSFFSLEAECFFGRDMVTQNRIMSALASGICSLKAIADATELPTVICNKALDELTLRGVVKKIPVGIRKNIYLIDSYLLRFYFEVVNEYSVIAEYYGAEEAYKKATKHIMAYLEDTFKDICMEYLGLHYDVSESMRVRIRDDMESIEADFRSLITESEVSRTVYGKCRLDGVPLGINELNGLIAYGKTDGGLNRLFVLFSGCGFTDELKAKAKMSASIRLVTVEDLYYD